MKNRLYVQLTDERISALWENNKFASGYYTSLPCPIQLLYVNTVFDEETLLS